MKNNLKKDFIWNTIGSMTNAITSLVFLIIVTRINGVDDAGIFTFAFSTACLLYIIGIYSGRTYQVTESSINVSNYDYIYSRLFTSSIVIIVALIFSFIKGYSTYKIVVILILAIFKAFESFLDVLYGIMQKEGELYKSGISMFLKAIIGITSFLLVDIMTKNIIYCSITLIIIYALIFTFYDIYTLKRYKLDNKMFNVANIINILKYGFFTFLFSFLTQYVINASKYAIDNYLSDDIQAIYGIIAMPATIMVLCSIFLIQPFLVKLTRFINIQNYKKFNNLVLKLILVLLILGILLVMITYFFGIPFLEVIYNIELDGKLLSLIFIIIGSILYGISSIISNALIILRKTLIQSIIFSFVSVMAFIFSNILVKKYEILGATSSYLLTMLLLLILYVITYIIVIRKCTRNEKSINNYSCL